MDDEEEEYDFEYSDEEQDEADIDVENTYYSAKGVKQTDPQAALQEFAKVISMESEPGEWGFKALKQMMKLHFSMKQYGDMLTRYRQLLTDYTATGAVTQNVSEKGINSILDYVSSCSDWGLLLSVYETTLSRLTASTRNERLWFKTNLKLGHLLHQTGDVGRLQRVIKELLKCCESKNDEVDSTDVFKKGTQLLEVYALQIQLYSQQRDTRKLRELYQKAMRVKNGVPHPRTLAMMQECGGKMYMTEKEYDQAIHCFFQSFKSYDETGDPRRLVVLKYLVLASMLHETTIKIDPFDSQEAKAYKDVTEIVAMRNLITAFRNDDVKEFERILKLHKESIMGDPFIRAHIDDLLRTVRTQVLVKLISPYTRISLSYIARELNGIPEQEVEDLLVSLILDKKILARIDQVNRILVRAGTNDADLIPPSSKQSGAPWQVRVGCDKKVADRSSRQFLSIDRMADTLSSLSGKVVAKAQPR